MAATIGQTLHRAREARALRIEDAAELTRIPIHLLRALEHDDFHVLPAAVYVRGFIRAYAGFLQLDANGLIAQLPAEWAPRSGEGLSAAGAGQRSPSRRIVTRAVPSREGPLRPTDPPEPFVAVCRRILKAPASRLVGQAPRPAAGAMDRVHEDAPRGEPAQRREAGRDPKHESDPAPAATPPVAPRAAEPSPAAPRAHALTEGPAPRRRDAQPPPEAAISTPSEDLFPVPDAPPPARGRFGLPFRRQAPVHSGREQATPSAGRAMAPETSANRPEPVAAPASAAPAASVAADARGFVVRSTIAPPEAALRHGTERASDRDPRGQVDHRPASSGTAALAPSPVPAAPPAPDSVQRDQPAHDLPPPERLIPLRERFRLRPHQQNEPRSDVTAPTDIPQAPAQPLPAAPAPAAVMAAAAARARAPQPPPERLPPSGQPHAAPPEEHAAVPLAPAPRGMDARAVPPSAETAAREPDPPARASQLHEAPADAQATPIPDAGRFARRLHLRRSTPAPPDASERGPGEAPFSPEGRRGEFETRAAPPPLTGPSAAAARVAPSILIDDREPDPASATAATRGRAAVWRRSPRIRTVAIAGAAAACIAGAAAGIAIALSATGSERPAASSGAGLTTPAAQAAAPSPTEADAATPAATEPPVTPTSAPPTPEPTPEPTPPPAPAVVPIVPDHPFFQCHTLDAQNYDCGPGPWRLICTPMGKFIDIEAVTPKPIPAEWPGWTEVTLTNNLDGVAAACR